MRLTWHTARGNTKTHKYVKSQSQKFAGAVRSEAEAAKNQRETRI